MNEHETFTALQPVDIAAVGIYFLIVIGVGFYAMHRSNRGTISGYFLAGRLMTWLPVGASLFASNIGSEHFIGLAGSGAGAGIAVGAFEINACILIQLLGWIFLPVFIACGVSTLPEYMNRRFGGRRIRTYLACLSMVLYIFTKISVNLYAGSLFINQSLHWNLYPAILFILLMTCLCTVTGGLAAVIYTDTLQTVVMLIGSVVLTVFAFNKVGGYSGLRQKYMYAIPSSTFEFLNALINNSTDPLQLLSTTKASLNVSSILPVKNASFNGLSDGLNINHSFSNTTLDGISSISAATVTSLLDVSRIRDFLEHVISTKGISHESYNEDSVLAAKYALCGLPNKNSWIMLRSPTDPEMPWPGFIFGQTTASIWYWCADQMMVQRALASKNLSHAQGGTLFAGYLKMLPLFFIIFPGMISRVLFPNIIACATPETCRKVCGNPTGCSNLAYPTLVLNILPVGLKGLILAVMLAALMSDLTSIFNSASTLFTIDVWKIIRPKAHVRELLIVGRLFVIAMTVIGIIWIPVIQAMQGGQLYIYIQSVAAYLSPPIASVYILAVLWSRCNEQGAFWSLMVGMVVGIIRMVLDFVYRQPSCGEADFRPSILSHFHYMYFAILLFWISTIVCIVVSLLTKPCPKKYLIRATYWTRFSEYPRHDDIYDPGANEVDPVHESPYPPVKDFKKGGIGRSKDAADTRKNSFPTSYNTSIEPSLYDTNAKGISLKGTDDTTSSTHNINPIVTTVATSNGKPSLLRKSDLELSSFNNSKFTFEDGDDGSPPFSTKTDRQKHNNIDCNSATATTIPPSYSDISFHRDGKASAKSNETGKIPYSAVDREKVLVISTSTLSKADCNSNYKDTVAEEKIDLTDSRRSKKFYDDRSFLCKAWDWFLGYNPAETEQQTRLNAQEYKRHMTKLTSLHQGPKAKICLNFNLIFIVTLALFMFIYYSMQR